MLGLKKKPKKEVPRVEYPEDEEKMEEEYEVGGEPVEPSKKAEKKNPPSQPMPEEELQLSISDRLDIIEGNLKRAYLGLDELRKITNI